MIGELRALIAKDLRELAPWAILCGVLGLLDLASELFKQPDMRPLADTIVSIGAESSTFMWMIAYAIGTGLATREQDEGTLAFLDGLPVRRSRVLAVKCAVATAMIMIAPTVSLLVIAALHALSYGSLDADLQPRVLLACYALQSAVIAHGVIVGAAMGFLRSLTWLITGAVASGLVVLVERVPRARALNPLSLGDGELTNRGIAIDWETAGVQGGIAAVALLIAIWGFARAGRTSRLDWSSKPVLKTLASIGTAVALIAAFALGGKKLVDKHVGGDEDVDSDEAFAREAPKFQSVPAQTVTRHYRISYPSEQSALALALADKADPIFERVHALMHVAPGEVIDVDASGSMRNTAGTAFYGRLRLELTGDAEITLAHETSHVIAQRIVGAERDWLWDRADTLNEGLATWIERHFRAARADALGASDAGTSDAGSADAGAGDAAVERAASQQAASRLLLAAMHVRRELVLEEIADSGLLATRRDGNLKYPIGEAVIRALVALYGEAAIPQLLRAFGDPNLAVDLRGVALWQAVFQKAGFDLGVVIDAMFRDIARDAEAHAGEIAALPRPRVRVVQDEDGALGVQAFLDGDLDVLRRARGGFAAGSVEPSRVAIYVALRFKPNAHSPLDEYEHTWVAPGMARFRDEDSIQGGAICVQPGVMFARDVIYEPWVCLPTSDAAAWQPPADAGVDYDDPEIDDFE